MRSLLIGVFVLVFAPVWAQQVVSGRLVDEQQQPVPYASVALADGQTGTASNEVGEFSLKVPALPQQLVVLSMGYERAIIEVKQAGPLAAPVLLRASAVQLPEVTVRANGEAEELVRRCYAKLLRHQNDVQYGRGFYRQKTREDGRYRVIFDAFYDIKITPRNMPSWVLGEARYALTSGEMAMANFSIYTRVLPLFITPEGSAIKTGIPLGPNAVERFYFVLRHTQRSLGREVAVIDYQPRSADIHAARGTLYVDAQSAALYRIEIDMPTKGLMTSSNPAFQIKASTLRVVTDYAAQNDSLTRIASTQVVNDVQFEVKGVPHESVTSSYFFIYEYGPPSPGQKYRATSLDVNDLAQIKKRRYRPEFWRNNAVLKDSPVEEQVIKDFEGKKVFGNLN